MDESLATEKRSKPRRHLKDRIARKPVRSEKAKETSSKQESIMITLLSIYCTDESHFQSQPMYIPASKYSLNET